MEHNLLLPLLQVLAEERRSDPDDQSAANIVAARLLRGPYLGTAYDSYQLAEIAPGEWRLFQDVRGEWVARDPLITFHDDFYMDEDEDEEGRWFRITPRPRTVKELAPTQGEDGIPRDIIARADALLGRVRQHAPEAVQRLLEPTPEQVQSRKTPAISMIKGRELGEALRGVLGDMFDASLKTYGIDYHSCEHWSHKSLYLVAHTEDEVAGVLKLGANEDWSYVLSYVSVAPGFRHQGLSKALYAKALELCERDQRVFVRSQPGDFTLQNPGITVGYDKLVAQSPVLHTDSESPFLYFIQKAIEQGMPYAQMKARFKHHCDAAIPSPELRQEGPASWQQRQNERERVARLLEEAPEAAAPVRRRRAP